MGYQEYICKIDNVEKFVKKRYEVDNFIDNRCFDEVYYDLIEFKEKFNDVEKGLYLYVYGDRYIGESFLGFLKNNIIDGNSYIKTIEEATGYIPFSGNENNYGDKIIKLFKEKSNSFGRVIYQKEPSSKEKGIELERSLF